jgi:hypothetical protein
VNVLRLKSAVFLAALLAMPLCAQSQQRDLYKVEFTIRDTGDAGGKTGRKYSLLVYAREKAVFKIGNRVPVATSSSSGGMTNTQFTYVDVGVNIDVSLSEEGAGRTGMHAEMDLSSAISNEKSPGMSPTISQIRLSISTSTPPGKPTVVASFDDPVTSRKFDVEALVTKVN